jgi:putative resolvase
MNGCRSKARRLLADPHVTCVVVEHKDRLGRMNVELVEAALSATGRRLLVLEDGEVEDDLVRDMVEVLTSFCAASTTARGAGAGTWTPPGRSRPPRPSHSKPPSPIA